MCIRLAPQLWFKNYVLFLLGLLISLGVFAQFGARSLSDSASDAGASGLAGIDIESTLDSTFAGSEVVTLALNGAPQVPADDVNGACTGGDSCSVSRVDARTVPTNVTEIFVSPSGDDTNAGDLAAPVRTLVQAQVLLRAQIARGLPIEGITVWMRGGTYALTSTLELNSLDSGSATSPVTWRAYQGETVRITGSKFLNPAEFVTTTGSSPIWPRLDTAARGNVMQIDLRAAGVTDFGTLQLRGFGRSESAALELIVNGKVQPLGRWPDVDQNVAPYNHGYMSIASESSATSFTTATDRMSRWTTAADAWLHGYFAVYWADEHLPMQSVSAPEQKITLGSAPGFGMVAGQSWYAYNLLEEITQPGEWYLDRSSGLLYLWPNAGFDSAEVQVSVLDGPLFSLNGASYITLQGLQLESTRAGLITVQDGTHNSLQQLVLRNAGTTAVAIYGGTNHRLSQSYVLDAGEDGVILSGGTRTMLVPGGHVLEDSKVTNNARFARTYHPAVRLEGVGHTVRNNLIHDTSHSAIMFTGNDHLIELNEIRNVLSATSDAGAIYTGRDWGARGNVIANNFIHNISSIFSSDAVYGIYLDDAVSGIEVRANVVYRVAGSAIVSSGGRDNLITNNVLARNGTAFNTDARAYQWWKDQTTDWVNGALLDALKALNYQAEPWASRYPQAAEIPNNWAVITSNDGNPWLYPQGTEFALNVGYANTTWIHGLEHTVWFKTFDHNISDQNPEFVDEDALDLTLQSTSAAFSLPGFQAIPFRSIGLRAQAMPPAVFGSQLNLSVSKSGLGSGTVVSTPEGINCGTFCSSLFAANAVVTLTAQPASGSEFAGWGVSCSGSTPCNVSMSGDKTVTAAFSLGTAGSCGSANGSMTNSTPTENLCAAGTPSAVSGEGPWNWTCNGSNGGTNASCSASLGTSPRLLNIATRGKVETVDNVMIAGFIIQGSSPKKVLIRARGPSLAAAPFNVPGTLSDPFLTLYSGATPIDSNDDFALHANAAQIPADWIPANAKEAAIVTTLNPGAYTAIVNGVGATSGVAIVEVFEIDQPGTPLINIATRGPVYTGDNVMIAGLIIQGDAPKTVLITARGPSMAGPPHNVPGTLANPTLSLFSGQTVIATNDNWTEAANAAQIRTAIGAPSNTLESAILVTLQPGAYTAIVSGAGGGTGQAIVEVFAQ